MRILGFRDVYELLDLDRGASSRLVVSGSGSPAWEVPVGLMTIGEFSERTRLSAKALRIYDRLGLVVPVRVEPANGYRYYGEEQVDDAVVVGLLRRLDMPLEAIAGVLDVDGQSRAAVLRSYWADVEGRNLERRQLAAYLLARLRGASMADHHVEVRSLPERHVASLGAHVSIKGLDRFFADAFKRLRSAGPGLEGIAGCPFVVYYGEVSADSDGPVELCRPLADLARASKGIDIRVEGAHEEVYVRLTKREMAWPVMRSALDELEAWTSANSRPPMGTFRQVLTADLRHTASDAPACDLSVPLRAAGQ